SGRRRMPRSTGRSAAAGSSPSSPSLVARPVTPSLHSPSSPFFHVARVAPLRAPEGAVTLSERASGRDPRSGRGTRSASEDKVTASGTHVTEPGTPRHEKLGWPHDPH